MRKSTQQRRRTPLAAGVPGEVRPTGGTDSAALRAVRQSLRESEERYRGLIERLPDALVVECEGRCVWANPAAVRLFGAPTGGNLIGRRVSDRVQVEGRTEPAAAEPCAFQTASLIRFNGQTIAVECNQATITCQGKPATQLILRDADERLRTAAELRESEAMASALINASMETVLLITPEGIVLAANSTAADRLKQPPGSLVGKNVFKLVPPKVAASRRSYAQQVVRTGEAVRFEDERFGRFVDTCIYPVVGADGRVSKLAVFARDITEQKAAENQMRQSRDFAEQLIRSANVMVIGLDRAGNITVFNEAAEELTGYTRAELLGRNWFEMLVPKARFPHVWEIFRGREQGKLPKHFENPIVTKTGGERVIAWRNNELRLDGRTAGTISFGIDITDHQRLERSLRESEERYRRLVELSPNFIGVAVEGKMAFINEAGARMLKAQGPAALLGHPVLELVHPRFREQAGANIEQMLAAGTPTLPEVETWLCVDGTPIEVQLRAFPFRFESSPAIYLVAEDITGRRRAEERQKAYAQQLQALSQQLVGAQERERRQLARELHDEIGQALTAIQINLQASLGPDVPAALGPRLYESLDLVEELIQKTQELSMSLRPPMLDDLGLVSALRWCANQVAKRSRLELSLAIDPLENRLAPEIETACFRVAQEALTNVVRHARASEVSLELRREGDLLHLIVRDDGIGFEVAEVLESRGVGSPLGLVGMQERAALAAGCFQCRSAPGEGTDVHVWFPLRWQAESEPVNPDPA